MTRSSTDDDWNRLAQALCFRDERHMYEALYEEEGLSVKEIAERLRVGTSTLNRRMHVFKIKKRSRGGATRGADKRAFLFYLDQRLICSLTTRTISDLYEISYSVVYQYKRWKAGGSFVGYTLTSMGRERTMEDTK